MFFPCSSNVWHWLEEADRWLFIQINSGFTNPFLDAILPWLRLSPVWLPLYFFIFVFVIVNFTGKSKWWILFFLTTVALTDMIGTYVFKHNFERLRPCSDPEFSSHVRLLLNQCAGGYSFMSNHAANHFGMAAFFYFSFRRVIPRWAWIGFVWAGAICYAQIYVGVHYPFDVAGGSILGLLVGSTTGYFFNKRFPLERQPQASLD